MHQFEGDEASEPMSPTSMDWVCQGEMEEASSILLPRLRGEMRVDKLAIFIRHAKELVHWEVPVIATEVWVATERLKQIVNARSSRQDTAVGTGSRPVHGVSVRLPPPEVPCLHPGASFR